MIIGKRWWSFLIITIPKRWKISQSFPSFSWSLRFFFARDASITARRGHRSQRRELLAEPAAEPALQGPPLSGHQGGRSAKRRGRNPPKEDEESMWDVEYIYIYTYIYCILSSIHISDSRFLGHFLRHAPLLTSPFPRGAGSPIGLSLR